MTLSPKVIPATAAGPRALIRGRAGFTLVELLSVIAVIALLLGIAMPAVNALKGSRDVTVAAYDLGGVLERARAYAMANSTYVWVGLFEEDGSHASARPAAVGTGRVVLSTVYSRDGSCIYDPSATPGIIGGGLNQLGALLRIENAHVLPLTDGTGNGTGGTGPAAFDGRPAVGRARVADLTTTAANGRAHHSFTYPAGMTGASVQYTFDTLVQFSPRGEARLSCPASADAAQPVLQSLQGQLEFGFVRSRGATPDTSGNNPVAVQLSGIAGNVKLYRR